MAPKLVTIVIRSREDTLPNLGSREDPEIEQFVRNDFLRDFHQLGWDVLSITSVTAFEPRTTRVVPRLVPRAFPRTTPPLFPREREQTQQIGPGGRIVRQPTPEEVEQGRRVDVFLGKEKGAQGFSYDIGNEPPPADAKTFVVDTEEKTTGLHFPTTVAALNEDEAMRIVERNPRFTAVSAKRLLGGP